MIRINRNLILDENDIIYVDHYNRQTFIHTINGIFSIYETTKSVAEKLPDSFIYINKALYVNKNFIDRIEGCKYELKNGEVLYGAIRKAGFHRRLSKEMKGILFIKKR